MALLLRQQGWCFPALTGGVKVVADGAPLLRLGSLAGIAVLGGSIADDMVKL